MFLIFLYAFFNISYAEQPKYNNKKEDQDYQVIQIYVDLSYVVAPDGSNGTSAPLNALISHYASIDSLLKYKMNRHTAPNDWKGEINVYDWNNVKYMPTYKECDYSDALKCGIQNNHWTLKTHVVVGEKFSVFTQKLYDNKGRIISNAERTAWGKVRWKPRWKLTRIKEQSAFGGASKEIFEQWPAQIEELPPLITPYHVGQARFSIYEIKKSACSIKSCKD